MNDERRKTVMEKNCGTCLHFAPRRIYQDLWGDCQYPLPEVLDDYRGTLLINANRETHCQTWEPN